jgi:hypothetical protein
LFEGLTMGRSRAIAQYPRAGEPWTVEEDRQLLELVKEGMVNHPNVSLWSYGSGPATFAAKALGRTQSAVQARLHILRVVSGHQRAGKITIDVVTRRHVNIAIEVGVESPSVTKPPVAAESSPEDPSTLVHVHVDE